MAKVFLTASVHKDLEKLPSHEQTKIRKKLILLQTEPSAGKKLIGKLEGLYSLKVWPYRIIYLIKSNKEVWVVHVLIVRGFTSKFKFILEPRFDKAFLRGEAFYDKIQLRWFLGHYRGFFGRKILPILV